MSPSPLVKATMQAAALSTGSNILAQVVEARQKNLPFVLNVLALLRFLVLTLITTPPNYKWQQFLERTFPGYSETQDRDSLPLTQYDYKRRNSNAGVKDRHQKTAEDESYSTSVSKPKLNLKNTFLKWFIDCMTVGTVVNTVLFLVIMGGLKGYSMSKISESVQKQAIPIIVTGYKIWPIVSIISFSFVPVEKRIVFLSSIGFLWGIYMSLIASRV